MAAIRRILCPVDFSEASERCVAQAAALARWRGAQLTVLHVQSPVTQRLPEPPPAGPDDPAAHASDPERVRHHVAALFETAGVPLGGADVLVDLGRPATRILDRAESLAADVIVIGSHGHSGVERLLIGSVAEHVLRRAPCDVLVVPSHCASCALPYHSILCGVDFSPASERALAVASTLAVDAGATLTAVHVISWPWDESPEPDFAAVAPEQARALEEYARYLERTAGTRLRALLDRQPVPPARCTSHVCHGRSYRELLQQAQTRHADLIVLGVHGRGPLDLAFFGSTANQVVRAASCPVWIARLPRS